jgi:hypothetical protein
MLREKFFCGCVKPEPIFRLGEAVALVGVEHVLVIDALPLHCFDKLLRFRLPDTRVICPLTNQDRYLDLIDLEEWRTRIEKCFFSIRVTDPLVECRQEGLPVGGMVLINVLRLDGPTMSTAQQKRSGINVAPTSAA